MAGQFPTPVTDWSDKEHEIFCFGPFAAADFSTAYKYNKLPIEFTRDMIIQDVRIKIATTGTTTGVISSAASTLYLAKGSVDATTKVCTKPAETVAIPANQQVCTGRLLNSGNVVVSRLEWLPVQKGFLTTAATTFTSQVTPGDPNVDPAGVGQTKTWDNIIERGNNLYLTTDIAAAALVGLWIQIRCSERKN